MLTASTADMWVPCSLAGKFNCGPGDLVVTPPVSDAGDSQARREGQAADWVASQVLAGDAASCAEMEGEEAPNGWQVSGEMCRYVQGYVDVVRSIALPAVVEFPRQFPGVLSARADAVVDDTTTGVLHVFQLKYGWQIVEAERNWQLLSEAICWFDENRHRAAMLTVVQPRPWHPDGPARTWVLDGPIFQEYARYLLERARLATGPDPIATPGPQCDHCAGRGPCYALQRTTYAARQVEEDRRVVHFDGPTIGREIAELRQTKALVEARLTALEAEAEGRIQSGEYIPGWHMPDRLGQRRLTAKPEAIKLLTGVDPYKKALMTVEELRDEGVTEFMIGLISERPHVARKLVPLTRKDFERAFKDHPAPLIKTDGSSS